MLLPAHGRYKRLLANLRSAGLAKTAHCPAKQVIARLSWRSLRRGAHPHIDAFLMMLSGCSAKQLGMKLSGSSPGYAQLQRVEQLTF